MEKTRTQLYQLGKIAEPGPCLLKTKAYRK